MHTHLRSLIRRALPREAPLPIVWGKRLDTSSHVLHLIKLCVGADSIEDLADWQKMRGRAQEERRQQRHHAFHAHDAQTRR